MKKYKKDAVTSKETAAALNDMLADLDNHRLISLMPTGLLNPRGKQILSWIRAMQSLQGEKEALLKQIAHLKR